MPASLLRWLRSRRSKSDLEGITSLDGARLLLAVDGGERFENPLTGGFVYALRIEVGFVDERVIAFGTGYNANPKELTDSELISGVRRTFHKIADETTLPNVVLRSRDGVRVLLGAGSYSPFDDVASPEFLDPAHPWAQNLPRPWPAACVPGYRSFSLHQGQMVLLQANLRPIAADRRGYRGSGEITHGCTLRLESMNGQPIAVRDMLGHPGWPAPEER
jgi:hypothetical protein